MESNIQNITNDGTSVFDLNANIIFKITIFIIFWKNNIFAAKTQYLLQYSVKINAKQS